MERCRGCRRPEIPHEYIYDLLMHGDLEFDGDPDDSWLMAAADANIPIFTPGWEDSTLETS